MNFCVKRRFVEKLKNPNATNKCTSKRVASRTGAEKPLSYLLCEAKALKIRLSLRMKFIRFYNLNIIRRLTH